MISPEAEAILAGGIGGMTKAATVGRPCRWSVSRQPDK